MSDMGETFAMLKKVRSGQKLRNSARAEKLFKKLDVDFREFNNGNHLRVMSLEETREFDFWPSSGRWIEYGIGNGSEGYVVDSLLTEAGYLKKKQPRIFLKKENVMTDTTFQSTEVSDEQKVKMTAVREKFTEVKALIEESCPGSRLRSEALTCLEGAGMWTIKAITRGPQKKTEGDEVAAAAAKLPDAQPKADPLP